MGYKDGGNERDEDGLQYLQEGEEEESDPEGASMLQRGKTSAKGVKFNSKGEKDCYHCGADDHWATRCPMLNKDQQ